MIYFHELKNEENIRKCLEKDILSQLQQSDNMLSKLFVKEKLCKDWRIQRSAVFNKIQQCFKWFNIFYSVQLKTWCDVKSVTKRKLCIDWCNFGELSKHHLIQQQAVHPDQGHSEDEKKPFKNTSVCLFHSRCLVQMKISTWPSPTTTQALPMPTLTGIHLPSKNKEGKS